MRRSQVTIFITIGLLIAILILFFTVLKSEMIKEKLSLLIAKEEIFSPEAKEVKNFIQECFENTSKDGLILLGLYGFKTELLKEHFENEDFKTNYLYLNNKILPTKKEIENSLSNYIKKELNSCVKNFDMFKGLNIKPEKMKTNVELKEKSVLIKMVWPIEIKKEEITEKVRYFEIELPIRLVQLYDFADLILEELDKKNLCLTCINKIGIEKNILTKIDFYGDDNIVFTLQDKTYTLGEEEYKVIFAAKQRLG